MYSFCRSGIALLALLLLTGLLAEPGMAQNKAALKAAARSQMMSRMQSADVPPDESVLDINNQTVWIQDNGWFHWIDPYTNGGYNGTFPKGTTGNVFAQGLVWGGKVRDGGSDSIRVGGGAYDIGLNSGKVLHTGCPGGARVCADDPSKDIYHVWRVRTDWSWMDETALRAAAASYFGVKVSDADATMMDQVRAWYEYDWMNWPADLGAPYAEMNGQPGYQAAVDANGNNRFEPEEGDLAGYNFVDRSGETPVVAVADQTIWVVANDLDDASSRVYGSPSIGLEYQATLWGYNYPETQALGNISFVQHRLIYTGTASTPASASIDSMFVVQWVDTDVGDAGDDYAGSDTTLGLGYAYNSSPSDPTYSGFGLPPSAIGFDFLQGPVTQEGDTLGMTGFVYFAAGSSISDPDEDEYEGSLQWFNLMRGLQPRPSYPSGIPFLENNQPVKFTLTGDPVSATGFLDGAVLPPGDRRIVIASGPFSMNLGDTVNVVVGQISGLGTNNISSVTVMKYYDQFAQYAYDNNFVLPVAAPLPNVSAVGMDKRIVLNWGGVAEQVQRTESHDSKDFQFEGYEVFQLPSPTAPLSQGVKVATYDLDNNISVIQDQIIDERTGFVIQAPVHIGPDLGLQRYYTTEFDAIRQRPLANGVEYYFAVRNYSYYHGSEETVPFRALPSPTRVITVVPNGPAPGVAGSTEFDLLETNQVAGSGDANIAVQVVDPSQLEAATYAVTINEDTWNLLKNNQPLLMNQEFDETASRTIVDGLQVNVFGITYATPPTILDDYAVDEEGNPASNGISLWGDYTLFGGAAGWYSQTYDGPAPTAAQAAPDLEFRFTGNGSMESATTSGGQLASYYPRAAFGADDLTGVESKVIRAPFELWDVENNRQINFAIIGRNADAASPWGNGVGDYYRMAARDYIVAIASPYNEADVQANGTNPLSPDATWLLFFDQGGTSKWVTGDRYRVAFANPVVPGSDRWEFTTTPPDSGAATAEEIDRINVFPNPYMGFNVLEASRYAKFMTFTHLPEQATIRIFNLAGIMVRRIEHEAGQSERWNLTNQDEIPVASGVYIAHISTDYGDKVLKLALVQEEQILERY